MDFTKTKPSNRVQDYSGDKTRDLRSYLFSPYMPWDDGSFDWTANEESRLKKGEDILNILRERMKNVFLENWLGINRNDSNFDFHREQFQTHSNLRKKSQGSSYDNY